MAVIYETNEHFDAGPAGTAVTASNTIFVAIQNGTGGTGIFTDDSLSGFAVTRPNSTGFSMYGFPLPGVALSLNSVQASTTIADPLGGTLMTSSWFKIVTPTNLGLGLALMYLETADVAAYEAAPENGPVQDLEAINILFAPGGYELEGGTAAQNLRILQRGADWSGDVENDWDVHVETFATVPTSTWLKYEMTYQEDGATRVTVSDEAGAVLVDTGLVPGPSGWRPSVVWLRNRYRMNANGDIKYILDDFHLRIETAEIVGTPIAVRQRFT